MFRDDLFAGSRVLVTGGGTGLGRMMAERLLSLGAAVEIWGRRGEVVQATAAEMNAQHPGRASARAVDIKDPEAIEAADRYYPAFRFLTKGMKKPEDALAACLFETVGSA